MLLARLLFLTCLALSFFACGPTDTSSAVVAGRVDMEAVPKLLDRNPAIRNGEEWDEVQNYYGTFRKNMTDGESVNTNRLNLAQLFILEARVTGEHGHYYPAALQLTEDILADPELTDEDLRFRTLTTKAGIQLSQHEFAPALETAKLAIRLNPYNAQIYGVLVDAHVELGDYDQAVRMVDRMNEIRPDLRSYARTSYVREIHGRTDGAIKAMERAVEAGYPAYEETAWAQLTLGELYQRYGQLDEAERAYRRILVARPNYPFAVAALAGVAYERGNVQEAVEQYEAAIALIPEFGFYESLARLYRAEGQDEKADALVAQIWPMLEDDVASGHNMNMEYANIYLDLSPDLDKALAYAEKEYANRPDNIDVNRLLARVRVARGELDAARPHLEKAAKTGSVHPELQQLKKALNG